MVEVGILGEDDRVELIDGMLVETSPQSERYVHSIQALNMRLVPVAAAAGLVVGPQLPLDVESPTSLPEPDFAVTPPGPSDRYPERAVLVVEIAVSSLRMDLGRKAALYAAAGIPEYWVVDVDAEELVVHREPRPEGYSSIDRLGSDDEVTALGLPLSLRLAELL